jgi:uncharacterized membrane protein YkoI
MSHHLGTHSPTRLMVAALCLGMAIMAPLAANAGGDDDALLPKLKTSKHTLVEGIQATQAENGTAISAKLEFEDGKLWLSVYTAKSGLEKDAEHNVLMELKGDATAAKWQPKAEVFEDKAHLARSAMQLTAIQTTTLTLEDVIKKVDAQKKGTVYSVIPGVRDGKTVFNVSVVTKDGKRLPMTIDEGTK